MSGIQQLLLGGPFGAGATGDPNWQNVALLSGTTSTNAGQNNTFLDSSSNNFTITRNGNTTQGTFTPFSQAAGYWGNYFDGNGDGISFGSNANTNPSSSDITVEAWIYPLAYNSYGPIFSNDINGGFHFGKIASGFGVRHYGTGDVITTSTTPSLNQWTHVAVSRSGNSWYLFYNGMQVATATASDTFTQGTACVGGNASTASEAWNGYLSNVRFVKGTALYTSNFTPSTTPLTAVTNTQLLTCQNNRFVDNSSNAYAVTVFGTPSVQPFQPFGAPTSPYSTTNVGGSGYFDGSGDYLSVADATALDLGTGDFTIEGWVYMDSGIADNAGIVAKRPENTFNTGDWRISYRTGTKKISFASDTTNQRSTPEVYVNGWVHFAFVRSGTTISCYANGTRGDSVTDAVNLDNANPVEIGRNSPSVSYTGYISGIRITKGGALYSGTTYTVPTAPFTTTVSSGSVSLLTNFTNASIFDNASKNDMETVGNAQVSTSVTKFGNSMAFDGSGDYLQAPSTPLIAFGTGDFTIESWIYFNSLSGTQFIIDFRSAAANNIAIFYNGTNIIYYANSGDRITASPPTVSTWAHLAVSRTAGVTKMYLNGNQVGSSYTDSNNYVASLYTVGSRFNNVEGLNGYLSQLRITNGVSRYPYNFTAPTQAFGTVYKDFGTPAADPYFDYTTLLLPGTGTNGAQNNTFLDSSTNAFSITRNGNTTQGTFSPFSQTGWSNYFDGTGDYLATSQSQTVPATGDFTVDGWFYLGTSSYTNYPTIFAQGTAGNAGRFIVYVNNDGKLGLAIGSTAQTAGPAVAPFQWNYFAITRTGSSVTFYLNGVVVGTSTNSGTVQNTTPLIGSDWNGDPYRWVGYLSNIRVSNTVRTISVPTAAFTSDANTVLLSCQSNRFIDTSSTAATITAYGNVSVQAFSPFAPTAAYSAGTNGGSGYFDGTGDYLSVAGNSAFAFGTGNFSIEFWAYWNSISGYQTFYDNNYVSSNNILIQSGNGDGKLRIFLNDSSPTLTETNAATTNQWYFYQFVRSGSTLTIYRNGVSNGSTSNSANCGTSGAALNIGQGNSNYYFNGYISDFRVLKGTASSATIPTAPLTNITNTSLLCNFTNAGITDATAKNDWETVGNAQISNGQAKWGSTSLYFDGSGGDAILARMTPDLQLLGSDWTIEYWLYANSWTTGDIIGSWQSGAYSWIIQMNGSGVTMYNTLSTSYSFSATLSTGQWYHVALSNYGLKLKCFINGNQIGSTQTITAFPAATRPLYVGYNEDNGGGAAGYNGYLQDVRITKGIARYTQNFTPPTAAFQLL